MADTGAGTVLLYDTTLRDGTQREGLSLSVEDKLRIARELDVPLPLAHFRFPVGHGRSACIPRATLTM